ncbi:hypothetical protein CRUP_005446 [Coryphaenoides rupestris]|nr:hypothetical protein CRUP_005446 [Coryphaenoides rupestris]
MCCWGSSCCVFLCSAGSLLPSGGGPGLRARLSTSAECSRWLKSRKWRWSRSTTS